MLVLFRLVPALNVIADHYKIPNDIVGATLMAAGASSPELLSSFVSLFITHSSLGLGTIVGSEIFNQLIICAGSVFASKTGTLALDQAIATREVSFYALAIGLLYYALQDSRPLDSDPDGPNYIFISFGESCLVFSGYLLYVLVCANMDTLVSCVTKTTKNISERLTLAPAAHYGSTKKVVCDDVSNNLECVPCWCASANDVKLLTLKLFFTVERISIQAKCNSSSKKSIYQMNPQKIGNLWTICI